MLKNRLPFILLLAVIAAVLNLGIFLAKASSSATLTPQERRGKQIYLKGISFSEGPIKAFVGDASMEVPGNTLPCANCHGYDGKGRPEGGVIPSNITWEYLTKSYDITHPGGRKHPAYTEDSIKRAIIEGIDPAGNRLAVAMPRYLMSHEDIADLVSYLKRLGEDLDPGLTETSIRIGTILPMKGPFAEAGQEMKAVMRAFFDEINGQGGIYSRKVELHIAESESTLSGTRSNAKHLIEDEKVFAILGAFTGGADKDISRLIEGEEIPLVGSFTFFPKEGFPLNRYIFYLFPGLKDQARVLIDFASQKLKLLDPRIAILYPDSENFLEVTGAIEEQGKKYGWSQVARVDYPPGQFEAAQIVKRLHQRGADIIFFFGSGGDGIRLMREADMINWTPHLFLAGQLAGKEILDAPSSFKGKIFLAYPTLPSDQTREGAMEYHSFLERHKLTSRHTAVQLFVYSSSKILVEGLKLAGKDLSREKLVAALEGFYNFDTGLTPRITYGPNRRIGALGAYVVTIDPDKKKLVPVSGWLAPK